MSISFLMDPWRRHLFRAVNTVCNMASLPTERIRRIKVFATSGEQRPPFDFT
jgi:hypothetical protein